MAKETVSQASFPAFYYGAMHHQAGGFLDGLLYGAFLRLGRD